jgi:hypothetical protein
MKQSCFEKRNYSDSSATNEEETSRIQIVFASSSAALVVIRHPSLVLYVIGLAQSTLFTSFQSFTSTQNNLPQFYNRSALKMNVNCLHCNRRIDNEVSHLHYNPFLVQDWFCSFDCQVSTIIITILGRRYTGICMVVVKHLSIVQ